VSKSEGSFTLVFVHGFPVEAMSGEGRVPVAGNRFQKALIQNGGNSSASTF